MRYFWIGLGLLLTMWNASAMGQPAPDGPSGDWRGTLVAGAVNLRLALHLGSVSTFDSPDQGAVGMPARMTVDGRKVVVEIDGVGVFEGTLSDDGATLEGALKQGPASIPLRFERGVLSAASRPQTPQPPFPYRMEEVAFDNPRQPDIRLAGTLTLPQGAGPFPAIILITGSGPQDRDNTLFEHKPFLVLADALTRQGIAVLRLDDRGVGGSTAGPPGATTADFVTDIQAASEWLRERQDIRGSAIGLLGHSEGAIIAPILAREDARIAFVVMLGGPGVSGRDTVVEQVRAIVRLSGGGEEAANNAASLQGEILDAVVATADPIELGASLDAITTRHNAPPIADAAVMQLTSPWYRYFLSLNPAPALRSLEIPVLALLGGKDTQVPADQNLPALRGSLGSNPRASVEVLPDLNHLLQTARTGAPDEYGQIEETIAPAALERIVDWVVSQVASPPAGPPGNNPIPGPRTRLQ